MVFESTGVWPAGARAILPNNWCVWMKPEHRCLVPANSFAEYAPEPNPETKKKMTTAL
jgi:putative SOS response-associated peptidase YedK